MKKCKRCGTLLDENVTTCPTCGKEKPFEDEKKKTEYDLTLAFDPMAQGSSLYRIKSRKKMLVLAFIFAFLGAPYFYMERKKEGWISLFVFLTLSALGAGVFSILGGKQGGYAWWMTLLPIIAVLLLENLIIGFYLLAHPSYKDGRGEYLR